MMKTSAKSDLDAEFARRLSGSSPTEAPVHEPGDSYEQQDRRIAQAILAAKRPGQPLRILEAGCGNRWSIDLGSVPTHMVGIDLDAEALRLRVEKQKDLDEAIHGDLSSTSLPNEAFDVVYSAFVLEHVERADQALMNLIRALRPGGLLVLRLPDPESARGFVTRRTPFWFHVLFAKYVEHRPNAGQPGYAPYPTYYHPSVWRRALLSLNRSHGLHCFWVNSDDFAREEKGILGSMSRFAAQVIAALSFGQLTSRHTNLIYFLRKAPA